jgi:type II secretory pathway component PulC
MMLAFRRYALVAGCLVFWGCFSSSSREPRFIEDIRPVPPALKVMSFAIQRRDLQETLTRTNENAIRLVPVYQNVSVRQSYEYRVFDVKDSSAYALLGIQSSDIIVAVDRYLLKRPEQFPAFVQLLAGLNEASIEVRRGGEARLFKYRFLPAITAD